ncbi:AMP-binding protein [Acrocarpospora sp. B8E8]|uniref:AMP-binding protein n=1 Tax=Acrocarpospora sp. B8E8 TaxID=3153572 RepID=UPI00325DCCFC
MEGPLIYPGTHAAAAPDRIAALMLETGESLTFGRLEDQSVRLSHVLRDAGLRRGDVVALLTDNDLRAFEIFWAALRTGCYITSINHHLSPEETAYIVDDSGATALIVNSAMAETVEKVLPAIRHRLRAPGGGRAARPGARGGDHRLREVEDRVLQGAEVRALRRLPAADRNGQVDEGRAEEERARRGCLSFTGMPFSTRHLSS